MVTPRQTPAATPYSPPAYEDTSGRLPPTNAGVPVGGTAGQFVVKASAVDYDTAWSTASGTVTNTGALTAGLVVVGNGGTDEKVLAAATDTWVLTQVAGIAAWAKASGGITRPKVQALFQLPTAL